MLFFPWREQCPVMFTGSLQGVAFDTKTTQSGSRKLFHSTQALPENRVPFMNNAQER